MNAKNMPDHQKRPIRCKFCDIEFLQTPSKIRLAKKNIFCCKKCKDDYERTIDRIIKPCKVCGIEMNLRKSEAHRFSTCSIGCRRTARADEKNPNWQGGITENRQKAMAQREYKQWRLAVFERDNYTCQFCHKRGGNIEADHIKRWKDFPELRYDITNGRTLCPKCHRTTFKNLVLL